MYLITSEISSLFLRGQLRFLIERGYSVVVGTKVGDSATRPFDDGVRVEDLPFVRDPSVVADVRGLFATWRFLRRERPGLVNASTPKAGLIGMVAAWLARVPVRVYVVRGLRFETMTGRRRTAYRFLERVAMGCATHVAFNSSSTRTVVEADGLIARGRGVVFGAGSGNGLDVSRLADLPTKAEARRGFGLPDTAFVIGFIGRLTKDKGIDDLVEAFVTLGEQNPEVWMLLVGASEAGDPIGAATLQAIDAHQRIVHVGWTDALGPAYRALDILAFPSYREGLPNVPLEAQYCEVPVIGYAASGTVDAVRDGVTGVLVPTGDLTALTHALLKSGEDPEALAALGRAGREWVLAAFRQDVVWSAIADSYDAWTSGG